MKRTFLCLCMLVTCILLLDGVFNSTAARRGGSYIGGYKGYGGGYRSYGGGYKGYSSGYWSYGSGYKSYGGRYWSYGGGYRGYDGGYWSYDGGYRSYGSGYWSYDGDYKGYGGGYRSYGGGYESHGGGGYYSGHSDYYIEKVYKKLNRGGQAVYYIGSDGALKGYIVYAPTNSSNVKDLGGLVNKGYIVYVPTNCQTATSYSYSEQECLKKEDLQKMCAICLKEDDRGCCIEYLDTSTKIKIVIRK